MVMFEGEPVPIEEDGRSQREAGARAGLMPHDSHSFAFEMVAYGEAPSGEA